MNQQSLPRWTKEEAASKIRHWCAYQERSQKECFDKLKAHGLSDNAINLIIVALIEENYLNEERFAKIFAGSKSRVKKWGLIKIKRELKAKGVDSAYLITKAMDEIDKKQYDVQLKLLAQRKFELLKGQQYLIKKKKLFNYLQSKGYSFEEINQVYDIVRK